MAAGLDWPSGRWVWLMCGWLAVVGLLKWLEGCLVGTVAFYFFNNKVLVQWIQSSDTD